MTDPLTTTTVTHEGFTTHYVEAGPASATAADTVVLVHDGWFGADARTLWEPVVRQLCREYRVLAPDMLGFGRTDKAVYFDRSMYTYRSTHLGSFVRNMCGADTRVHLVGTSMGGSILLRDAAAAQPRIPGRSVVSISGSGGPWRSSFGAQELARYVGERDDIARVLAHMADDFGGAEQFVDRRHENTRVPGHVECLLAAGAVRHPSNPRTPPQDPWPAPLADVQVPVTVVAGRRDPLLEPGWEKNLVGLSDLLEVVDIDTLHAPSLDHPEVVADIVRRSVQRADDASEGAGDR